MKKALKAIALCSIILTLSACGSKTASIDGTWYSSKGSAQLVFDDGAFSSPDLSYLPGEATLEGDVISIADNLGDTTELYLFDKDIITTKQYTEKDFEWAFFRSREAADQYAADYEAAAEERAAKEEQAKQEQLEAEAGDVMKYLTQGVWERLWEQPDSPTFSEHNKATYTFAQDEGSTMEGTRTFIADTSSPLFADEEPTYFRLNEIQQNYIMKMYGNTGVEYDVSGTLITLLWSNKKGEFPPSVKIKFFLYEQDGKSYISDQLQDNWTDYADSIGAQYSFTLAAS